MAQLVWQVLSTLTSGTPIDAGVQALNPIAED
jgi:hypothetical protein